MGDEDDRGKQTRQREAVADLLHQGAGRAQRGRGNVRAAVVVHDDTDGDVQRGHDELAQRQGLEVLLVVLHLGHNVEVGGGTGIRKDQAGQRGRSLSKSGRLEELKVGLPRAELGRRRRALLETDRHGKGDDCCCRQCYAFWCRTAGTLTS